MTTVAWKYPLDTTLPEPLRCECCRRRLERPRTSRRFGLLDGMILVAATAASLSIARHGVSHGAGGPWLKGLVMAPIVLAGWSLALLGIRLRRPRPQLRRVLRQPGSAASIAASAIVAVIAILVGIATLVRHIQIQIRMSEFRRVPFPVDPRSLQSFDWMFFVSTRLTQLTTLVGPAVLGTWVVLALSGRRRPERGLIDGLGRAVGTAWIVLFVGMGLVRMMGSTF